jgi:hypothetical protein
MQKICPEAIRSVQKLDPDVAMLDFRMLTLYGRSCVKASRWSSVWTKQPAPGRGAIRLILERKVARANEISEDIKEQR